MARGDPRSWLENLVPLLPKRPPRDDRGSRPVERQITRYDAMADRCVAAAVATHRLRRQREQKAAATRNASSRR